MSKLLIAIFSCNKEPYTRLLKAAQETWAGVLAPNVTTLFFYSSGSEKTFIKECNNCYEVGVEVSDAFNMQHWKFKKMLDAIENDPRFEFDFLLKGTQNNYFDKVLCLKKCDELPKTKCYFGGLTFPSTYPCYLQSIGANYAFGAANFISKDVAMVLKNNETENPHDWEDILVGEICHKNNIPLIDIDHRIDRQIVQPNDALIQTYHYRCKNDVGDKDRDADIKLFHKIHKFKGF